MRFWVLHLSDIHLFNDADPVLGLADAIAAATTTHNFSDNTPRPETLVLALTGDLTADGAPEQYTVAQRLIERLLAALQLHFRAVHLALTPGNHDLRLLQPDSSRSGLLRGYDSNEFDADYFAGIARAQASFWTFAAAHAPSAPQVPAIGYDTLIPLPGMDRNIRLRSVNTAWCSTMKEVPGTLRFPAAYARALLSPPDANDLVLTLCHHPYRWLHEHDYRAFKKAIEDWSDVVLTGHEHVPDTYESRRPTEPSTLMIEGGVLQRQTKDRLADTTFNLIELDAAHGTYALAVKSLVRDQYVTTRSVGTTPLAGLRRGSHLAFPLNTRGVEQIDDIGDVFCHPRRPRLRLSDIYVEPDLLMQPHGVSADIQPVRVLDLFAEVKVRRRVLLTGAELSGKTSILRTLFARLHDSGALPLIIDAQTLRKGDVHGACLAAAKEQYATSDHVALMAAMQKSGVVLVDDLNLITTTRTQNDVLSLLEQRFHAVVATGSVDLPMAAGQSGTRRASTYAQLQIQELTHVRRGDMIERWVLLGVDEEESQALTRAISYRDRVLSRIMRTNLLPSYPYYVLLVLQQLDAHAGEITDAHASHGYLYEAALTHAMQASRIVPAEIKYDYITAFAGFLHEKLGRPLESPEELLIENEEFARWHAGFCGSLGVSIAQGDVTRDLLMARIFRQENGLIGFRYKNTYFYGRAKWLSDRPESELQSRVQTLVDSLYLEESYAVLMFLAHLDRRAPVAQTLLAGARALLADSKADCILVSARELADDLRGLPPLELPLGTFKEKRKAILEEFDTRISEPRESDPAVVNPPQVQLLRDLNAALRIVHTLGQLLRRHGASETMSAETKIELVSECYDVGLRLLAKVFSLMRDNLGDLRRLMLYTIMQERTDIDEPYLLRIAVNQAVGSLALAFSVGVVRSVSEAVGTRLLTPTIRAVAESRRDVFSFAAIDLSVAVDIHDHLPLDRIKKARELAEKAPLGEALIARLTWLAMRRYEYPPLELERGCEAAGIARADAGLLDPNTKKVFRNP